MGIMILNTSREDQTDIFGTSRKPANCRWFHSHHVPDAEKSPCLAKPQHPFDVVWWFPPAASVQNIHLQACGTFLTPATEATGMVIDEALPPTRAATGVSPSMPGATLHPDGCGTLNGKLMEIALDHLEYLDPLQHWKLKNTRQSQKRNCLKYIMIGWLDHVKSWNGQET